MGRFVRIEKIGTATSESWPAADPATHAAGTPLPAGTSLPISYVMECWMSQPPCVGARFRAARFSRNGKPSAGLFTSGDVVEVLHDGFRTANSIYRITLLDGPSKWAPIPIPSGAPADPRHLIWETGGPVYEADPAFPDYIIRVHRDGSADAGVMRDGKYIVDQSIKVPPRKPAFDKPNS